MSSRLSIARSNMSFNTSSLSCVEMDEHDELDLLLEQERFGVLSLENPALRLCDVDKLGWSRNDRTNLTTWSASLYACTRSFIVGFMARLGVQHILIVTINICSV